MLESPGRGPDFSDLVQCETKRRARSRPDTWDLANDRSDALPLPACDGTHPRIGEFDFTSIDEAKEKDATRVPSAQESDNLILRHFECGL
jgi:hypothetical protein